MSIRCYLLVFLTPFLVACSHFKSFQCEENWQLTGYFVPIEDDYKKTRQIDIAIKGGMTDSFDHSFLKAVKLEGWGKTSQGWYLGFYSKQWHKSNYPLDAKGKPLKISTIAADTSQLPFGSQIYIPTLNSSIKQPLIVNDVGKAIKGKRIDIYTGEGKEAQLLTYQVTNTHQICWQDSRTTL